MAELLAGGGDEKPRPQQQVRQAGAAPERGCGAAVVGGGLSAGAAHAGGAVQAREAGGRGRRGREAAGTAGSPCPLHIRGAEMCSNH